MDRFFGDKRAWAGVGCVEVEEAKWGVVRDLNMYCGWVDRVWALR